MKNHPSFYTTSYLIWMFCFFVLPTCIVFLISFIDHPSWNHLITAINTFYYELQHTNSTTSFLNLKHALSSIHFTISSYTQLTESRVSITLARTLLISLGTAIFCIFISLPSAYFIADSKHKNLWILLLILPFWTNFLIRIFMWIKILGNNGILNKFLLSLHMIKTPITLLYNNVIVTFVCIYITLPFAIIPIFSAIEKFDRSIWEASEDLGAKSWQTFLYIFIPGIKHGISSAFVFSFINTFGNYAVAKLVGGQDSYVLGNLVVHNATIGRNLPLAAAISTVICIISILIVLLNRPVDRNNS